MKRLICKIFGHKRGFIHRKKHEDIYCCKRCQKIVYEERAYEKSN